MAGTPYKRKSDGKWCIAVTVGAGQPLPPGATRRPRVVFYGDTVAEAKKKAAEFEAKERAGVSVAGSRTTVEDLLTDWIRDIIKPGRAENTYYAYEQVCRNHLIPALGNRKVSDLNAREVQSFIARLKRDGRSDNYIRDIRRVLVTALNQALRWGMCARNVALLTELPRREPEKPIEFADDSVERILAAIRGAWYEQLFMVQFTLGGRISEICSLKLSDLERDESGAITYVSIQEQIPKRGETKLAPLKTKNSKRLLPCPAITARILEEVIADTAARDAIGIGPGGWQVSTHPATQPQRLKQAQEWGLIFRSDTGCRARRDSANYEIARLTKAAGIEGITTHKLRHLFTTELLKRGISIQGAAAAIGTTPEMVEKTYGHVLPAEKRAVATQINAVFNAAFGDSGYKSGYTEDSGEAETSDLPQ